MKKKLEHSKFIAQKRPVAEKLLSDLLDIYPYASVLVTDVETMSYRIGKSGIQVSQTPRFGGKGMVVKVYDGVSYAEYSGNEIDFDALPGILDTIENSLVPLKGKLPEGLLDSEYQQLSDTGTKLVKASEYEIDPREMGDEAIIKKLTALREFALAQDERLLDSIHSYQYQINHKLFLSKNRDMEQSAMWGEGFIYMMVMKDGDEVKDYYKGFSVLGGAELLDEMEQYIPENAKKCVELLNCESITPGTYTCICTPEVTGMIVHEAFGHGVEMDMFVKDRALAKNCMNTQVASDLITMRDGNSLSDVATYFFDDEGTPSADTVVIDKGILKAGFSDAQSAMHLGTAPTGNGRRESYERKAYTRMTNTYFEAGTSSVEDMIASVEYGMLLEAPSSGMEDPKNWGIQCMVNIAREIKNGRLTGRVFSPIVLTGYVPDLLKSISMISDTVEHCGSGACGKGYKEWVKVSDGGPYIKAQIRLG